MSLAKTLGTTLLLCFALAAPVAALESDRRQPIELSADSVDLDEGRGISVYRGNVDLRQGSMQVLADVITVHHADRKPVKMVAEGSPVRFRQESENGPVRGEARRVEYAIDSENLVLSGKAVLVQGKDSMRSDRIVYDRERAVVRAGAAANGTSRVQISIEAPSD